MEKIQIGRLKVKGNYYRFIYVAAYLWSFFSTSAIATVEITASAGHINNPIRLEENQQHADEKELESLLAVAVSFERETKHFKSEIDYNAEITRYKNDFLDDGHSVAGKGSISWIVRPEILSWEIANTRSDENIDITLPNTINNREVVSITSTGPRLNVPFGLNNKAKVELDYAQADYEESAYGDQVRKSGLVQISRNLNRNLTGALNVRAIEIDFEEDEQLNYDAVKYTGELGYNSTRYSTSIEVGTIELKKESGLGDRDDLFVNFNAAYTPNSRSGFYLSYSESIEDKLSNILSDGNIGESSEIIVTQADSVDGSNNFGFFLQKRIGFSYAYNADSGIGFGLEYTNDDRLPEDESKKEELETIIADVNFPLSLRFEVGAYAGYSDYYLEEFDRTQERTEVGLVSRYQFNDRLGFQFSVSKFSQESDDNFNDFESWEAYLSFSYILQK